MNCISLRPGLWGMVASHKQEIPRAYVLKDIESLLIIDASIPF